MRGGRETITTLPMLTNDYQVRSTGSKHQDEIPASVERRWWPCVPNRPRRDEAAQRVAVQSAGWPQTPGRLLHDLADTVLRASWQEYARPRPFFPLPAATMDVASSRRSQMLPGLSEAAAQTRGHVQTRMRELRDLSCKSVEGPVTCRRAAIPPPGPVGLSGDRGFAAWLAVQGLKTGGRHSLLQGLTHLKCLSLPLLVT